MNNNGTTIRVANKTKELLNKVGSKGETYNDIIVRLIKKKDVKYGK